VSGTKNNQIRASVFKKYVTAVDILQTFMLPTRLQGTALTSSSEIHHLGIPSTASAGKETVSFEADVPVARRT